MDRWSDMADRLECCGKVSMGCVSAASVTFHLLQSRARTLRVHFGNCISYEICPVSKWQNTVSMTMLFLPSPSCPHFPSSTSKEKWQRQGRNGKFGGGVAGRKRWVKGRKRKDQEIAINVCKSHLFWWAQDLVLFSVFLRVKISNNQVISNTSVTCLAFPTSSWMWILPLLV